MLPVVISADRNRMGLPRNPRRMRRVPELQPPESEIYKDETNVDGIKRFVAVWKSG